MNEEPLWKQCAAWLCRMKVLPTNHRITWPDATCQHLAYTLRDGVVLCFVASALHPASIEMKSVNLRPQMAQFLCLKNIKVFLKSCDKFFDLKDVDLFDPSMLYGCTDFGRVLNTLSKLSNCSKVKAARPDLLGFSAYDQTVLAEDDADATINVTPDEQQIYKTLQEINDEKYKEYIYKHHGGSSYGYSMSTGGRSSTGRQGTPGEMAFYMPVDQEEVIYEDLCSFKATVPDGTPGGMAEASSSSSLPRLAPHLTQPKGKRDYCLKELIETEANYVDVLSMLRKHFVRPMTSLKESDKEIIFANIRELLDIHSTFYAQLLDSVGKKSIPNPKNIGDVFSDFKIRFLIYGDFCSGLPVAQQTLDAICDKDEAVAEEVAQCEKNANGSRFRLRDLLAVPMQRVLKYHLLLKELLTHTPSVHEEFLSVEIAYESMVDVSEYINEVKRDSEQIHIISAIQNSISDLPEGLDLREAAGRLRKDAELKVQSHEVNAKTKVRYVFVFDRLMMMCKSSKGDTYGYKDSLKLADYKIEDVGEMIPSATISTTGRRGRDSLRWAHSFMLFHGQRNNAYTLFTKTLEEKAKWMDALGQAIDSVLPPQRLNTNHHVIMASFKKGLSCGHCDKLLKGLFYQGYTCTICSILLHRDCISFVHKCGVHGVEKIPPALPPRPSSMYVAAPDQQLSRFSSSVSLSERQLPLPPAVPPQKFRPPPLNLDNGGNPDYINTKMEDHTWFVGEMDRPSANQRLADYPVCTFLVRCRIQNGEKVGFALSLKTDRDVKHMKICVEKKNDNPELRYYLSDNRKFRSVVELVAWYSLHSLRESFSGLDTRLRFSVGELTLVEAQYEFAPALSDKNMLSLLPGDRLVVLDRNSGNTNSQGWWKACKNNRTGYIPKDFVKIIDVNQEALNDNEKTVDEPISQI